MGAQLSERTTLTVGAAPERVAWGIDRFLDARRSAGLDERLDGVGVYVNLAVHPDPVVARRLVRGVLATFSRFSVMHGDVTGGAQGDDAATLDALHQAYDMNAHATTHASHQAALPDDFVDRMAVVGTPEHCLDRLSALRKLGVTRFIVMQLPRHDPESAVARELLVREVLPVVRSW